MTLVYKKREYEMRRTELYATIHMSENMAVERFEHLVQQINILTAKIVSFKGGLHDKED